MKCERGEEKRIQAEIAGGTLAAANEPPVKGQYLREFELPSSSGAKVRLSDYRGRAALVLIVCDASAEPEKLLTDLAQHYAQIRSEDAEVLAIVDGSPEQEAAKARHLPFPVLADADGRVHRALGAGDSAAVYVTDRFGEVFGVYRKAEGQALPGTDEILRMLEFVSVQCPECEPPEWPV